MGTCVCLPNVTDGQRGWCRVEYFLFGLYSEMLAAAASRELGPLRLFAIGVAGGVQQFKVVEFLGGDRGDMPSQGTFTFADDRERIARLEDQMISAFGYRAAFSATRSKAVSAAPSSGAFGSSDHRELRSKTGPKTE